MTAQEFASGINKFFNEDPSKFVDNLMLMASKEPHIDTIYLEEWLSKKVGYNEEDSLQENIANLYGEAAARFVEKAI